MLVVALAHAQKLGEGQFINRHVCVSHYILTVDEVNSIAVPLVKEMGGLFRLEYLTAKQIVRMYMFVVNFDHLFFLPLNSNADFSVVQHDS